MDCYFALRTLDLILVWYNGGFSFLFIHLCRSQYVLAIIRCDTANVNLDELIATQDHLFADGRSLSLEAQLSRESRYWQR